MGNILSRKTSIRKILFTMEEKIKNTETYLKGLKQKKETSRKNFYYLTIYIGIPFIAYIYISNKNLFLNLFIFLLSFFVLRFILFQFFDRKINYNQKLLGTLKETQKKRIEELKKESLYLETKELVEKYDVKEIEKRNISQQNLQNITPVKNICKTKRGIVDKFADFIIGEDPSSMYALICEKCFSHNGLSHPLEYNLMKFRCFNCEHLNDKTVVLKNEPRKEEENKGKNKEKDKEKDKENKE
ncbi:putative zinc-ribbon metal-binding protein [Hamiltosporidium tvaerminnensis]|uniref:Endoplasmic reticulum junction formation protein lunapark n=1 Tax=Hamiltosporidium tvaerminnensis TaxID=1176355 RepID=A0A4Q9KRP2_9MICR|nr:putative zinc-ribbon metal-binding protein [Hamiltosporidium tvaerminnensis]